MKKFFSLAVAAALLISAIPSYANILSPEGMCIIIETGDSDCLTNPKFRGNVYMPVSMLRKIQNQKTNEFLELKTIINGLNNSLSELEANFNNYKAAFAKYKANNAMLQTAVVEYKANNTMLQKKAATAQRRADECEASQSISPSQDGTCDWCVIPATFFTAGAVAVGTILYFGLGAMPNFPAENALGSLVSCVVVFTTVVFNSGLGMLHVIFPPTVNGTVSENFTRNFESWFNQ
jgi:hypothetical protein